jgi:hypothetical protein
MFIPKAHALYWEDEGDEDNNPNEVKRRPDHFSLFDWMGDLDKDAKKKEYQEMDNRDRGPAVNNEARSMVIISSGVVGLAAGIFMAYELTPTNTDLSSNMFIGGAVGLGVGFGVGALIMPGDYEVDQRAQTDFLKQRQAWLEDPLRLEIAKSFHPTQVSFSLKF